MAHNRDRPVAWVTGATGFLGRHVALALMKRGYRVVGFARSPHIDTELTAEWGFDHVEYGAVDAALLSRGQNRFGPPQVVFHAIGSGSVSQAGADPAADIERTLRTTECVLEALDRTAPRTRFIYPSSAAVYGTTPAKPIGEDAPTQPISLYGENKLRAEEICRDFAQRSGLQIVALRFFSVYGPPQRKLLFWDLGRRLLSGERKITLGGTGEETRDLVSATDAAAIVAELAGKAKVPTLLNVGTGRATSVKTLAGILARALGVEDDICFDGRVRPGDPPHQQADISRLASLGLTASITPEEGLVIYARWLQSIA